MKTHHVHYLVARPRGDVGALRAGQRTPLFHLGGGFPGGRGTSGCPTPPATRGPGVVRCEAPPDLDRRRGRGAPPTRVTAALPRFASEPHKDPRAPQNLHPIAGLERELRRRLGDPRLLERALRQAAARAA